MQVIDYISKRNQFLYQSMEIKLMGFLRKSMESLNLYAVHDGNIDSIFFVKITDQSFFDEYYSTYIHLYEGKFYFIWYKLCFDANKQFSLRKAISRNKRKFIYKRDGYSCVVCKSMKNITIDHLRPRSQSNDDSFYNLVTMCRKCNEEKRDADWGPNFIHDVVIPHIKKQNQ